MSKPKSLPKRRDGAFIYPANLYIDAVRALARRNDIDVTDKLCSEIETAIRNYHVFTARDSAKSAISEQRQRLTALRDHAAALRQCLAALSTDETMQLQRCDRPDDDVLFRFDEDLLFMEANADAALSRLADQKSPVGRKPDNAFIEFIAAVHRIYTQATGRDDWYTRDTGNGEITGKFVEFLRAVLPASGIEEKSDSTLSEGMTAAKKIN